MQVVLNFFKNLIGIFTTMKFPADFIDIILVAVIIYYCLKFARDTRMGLLLRGVLIVFLLYLLSNLMELSVLSYFLKDAFQLSFIAIIILFQPEMRSFLEKIGRMRIGTIRSLQTMSKGEYNIATGKMIDGVCESCKIMSERRIGALMVFESSVKLGDILDTGISVDAVVTPQTIITIFFPNTPLHDGAVIIRDNKISSAGCLLPLSKNLEISKELGTRHRAAVGITETSDALAVVVSEETGKISYAINGRIYIGITEDKLRRLLEARYLIRDDKKLRRRARKEVSGNEK